MGVPEPGWGAQGSSGRCWAGDGDGGGGEEGAAPHPEPPDPPERGLHISLPSRSSGSGGAGGALRNGDSAVAPGEGAGGSSSSLEPQLEGLGWSHSAGPRGAPGAWPPPPSPRSARDSPGLGASAGDRPGQGRVTETLGSPPGVPTPPTPPPFSVRRRKDSLRRRSREKPPSSSSLPGEPGIMLVCGDTGGAVGGLWDPPPACSGPPGSLSPSQFAQRPLPCSGPSTQNCTEPPRLLRTPNPPQGPPGSLRAPHDCSKLLSLLRAPPIPSGLPVCSGPIPTFPPACSEPPFLFSTINFSGPPVPLDLPACSGPPILQPHPPRAPPHVAQVEGDLEGAPEAVGELGVHVQHLEQVLTQDLVQVAVGESPNVRPRLPGPGVQVQRLPEGVVLTWGCGGVTGGPGGPRTAPGTPAAAAAPKGALLIEANSGGYPEGREGSHQGCEQGWGDPREHPR